MLFLEVVFEVIGDQVSDWHLAVDYDALVGDGDVPVGLQHRSINKGDTTYYDYDEIGRMSAMMR